MVKLLKKLAGPLVSLFFLLNMTSAGYAETTVSAEVGFIFNTFLFLVCGFLVMFMAAGFAMLESGMVTSKSVSVICAKNIGLFSIAGIMFWMVGYNLAYGIPEGGYIGSFTPWSDASSVDTGYADGSDWYFQMVFCATTVSIVSGTLAERIKLWPFFLFAAILSGIIYPIVMGWQWGGGWLAAAGFSDFAGSTLVHSTGGAAALAGAILLGARTGRFDKSGAAKPMKPFAASSVPLVTVGVFILWLGWFGFNGGSELKVSEVSSATAVSQVFLNTNMAAAGGVLAAMLMSLIMTGKMDVTMAINGAIAGLVSITADPLSPSGGMAILVGAIGGAIVYFSIVFLENAGVDDPVGAISAHGTVGIFGVLAVAFTGGASFMGQLIGVLMIAGFTYLASLGTILVIDKLIMPIRASDAEQEAGLDISEVGIEAYPEFK